MFNKKGFTLIELLIVLIIIGVLATLAIPQYTNYIERARGAEALSMIGALKTAEATYKLTNNIYTTNLVTLSNDAGITGFATDSADATAKNQYWFYTGDAGGMDASGGYRIIATRSGVKATSTPPAGQTIYFTYSDTTGISWSGLHPGVPK
ncbi:MAG: prepilin-type N-terminal cleavage/methylation domain-containing protein [Candidatus Omnitrophica bacterium]|nr:prepilin-type N-terminal cleavage/methylation domain-containing protein [Candidatus Omnitrophota bacterium]